MNTENQKGRIFDIQRFSVHDGPGIRTIVFLKGCFLRCKWCCNPESQNYNIENMVGFDGKTTVTGKDVTVKEVMKTVLSDSTYYRRSGGGITLSGGEFLYQPDFSLALLKTAKNAGLNTAVETTSFANIDTIRKMLPYIDNYLMDIKHINPEKHLMYTGRDNALILENARTVAKEFTGNLIIRVPVIPGFNDGTDEISQIAEFVAQLKTPKGLHLLPYHRLGQDKYSYLNRDYELSHIVPPSNEKMGELLAAAQKSAANIPCQIGG